MTNPGGNATMDELLAELKRVAIATEMTSALLGGQHTNHLAEIDSNIAHMLQYTQRTYTPGLGGATPANPTGGRFTASGNQTGHPAPAWGGHYPGDDPYQQSGGGFFRNNAAYALNMLQGTGSGDHFRIATPDPVTGERRYHLVGANGVIKSQQPIKESDPAYTSNSDARRRSSVGSLTSAFAAAGGASGVVNALSGMPGGLGKVGKVLKGALGVANSTYGILNFKAQQLAVGAGYESIYNEGWEQGQQQRLAEMGWEAQNITNMKTGSMTPAMAQQAWNTVSAMGYQGDERQKRLDFLTKNYANLGMDVSESSKYLELEARGGFAGKGKAAQEALNGLSDALKNVSDMAKLTGQSAVTLRDQFSTLLAGNIQAGFNIKTATSISQGQTAATAGFGRSFAGTSYNMTEGMLSVEAATSGYGSELQFLIAADKNPDVYNKAVDRLVGVQLDNIAPMLKQWVQSEIKRGRAAPKTEDDALPWVDEMPDEVAASVATSFESICEAVANGGGPVYQPGKAGQPWKAIIAWVIWWFAGGGRITKGGKGKGGKSIPGKGGSSGPGKKTTTSGGSSKTGPTSHHALPPSVSFIKPHHPTPPAHSHGGGGGGAPGRPGSIVGSQVHLTIDATAKGAKLLELLSIKDGVVELGATGNAPVKVGK